MARQRRELTASLVWLNGNDFQTWRDAADNELALAVARGIKKQDPGHIQTVELNYLSRGSFDDPSWAAVVDLDAAYTYFPTYAQVLAAAPVATMVDQHVRCLVRRSPDTARLTQLA